MSKLRIVLLSLAALVVILSVACTTTSPQTTNSSTLDAFRGTYRGFGPTDESAVMMGELEITVGNDQLAWRMATGHSIVKDTMSFDNLRPMSSAEIAAIYADGSSYPARITGFADRNGRLKLLFLKDPKSDRRDPEKSEFGLMVFTGGAADAISPELLYSPTQIASGDYARMFASLEKDAVHAQGTVPQLAKGGK